MRYRVEAEGGTMQLVSSPGAGTLIEATLPAPRPEQPVAMGHSDKLALPAAA